MHLVCIHWTKTLSLGSCWLSHSRWEQWVTWVAKRGSCHPRSAQPPDRTSPTRLGLAPGTIPATYCSTVPRQRTAFGTEAQQYQQKGVPVGQRSLADDQRPCLNFFGLSLEGREAFRIATVGVGRARYREEGDMTFSRCSQGWDAGIDHSGCASKGL